MPNILKFCSVIIFILLYILFIIKFTHMFQLNSYKPKEQLKWLYKNKKIFIIPSVLLVLSFAAELIFNGSMTVCAAVTAVLFGISIFFNLPKKAKKPLVYTKRVIRMLVTVTVLSVAAIALSVFIPYTFTLLCLILLFSPFILLLCNLINQPIEKSINRHYINDAKNILKNHTQLNIIGVTGSYGKTSMKYILGTLLEAKYNVLITPESYNTPLGIVKTIRGDLRGTHDIFVCEMGAKNIGDIKEICDIVHPQNGIITSVGPQHLETFKSLSNVCKTKFELADSLPSSGCLLLNGEDQNILDYADKYNHKTYGLNASCDYYAHNLSVTSHGTSFTVTCNGESVLFNTSLIGKHNVINLVGAIAMSCETGIKLSELPPYVRKVTPVPHRLQLIKRGNTVVIDDAYNSNPAGAKAALEALNLFEGYKILITPGMIELGSRQDEENRIFGENAAKVCDFVALVGIQQTKSIFEGLLNAGFDKSKIFVTDRLNEAAALAFGLDAGDKTKIVLFENDLPDNY